MLTKENKKEFVEQVLSDTRSRVGSEEDVKSVLYAAYKQVAPPVDVEALANKVGELVVAFGTVTTPLVKKELGCSGRAANAALRALVERGAVEEVAPGTFTSAKDVQF